MVMPTDAALKDAIKEMLVGANLEELTVKKIRTALQEKFDADLALKKASASRASSSSLHMRSRRSKRYLMALCSD
jgi:DEK C terminal domain